MLITDKSIESENSCCLGMEGLRRNVVTDNVDFFSSDENLKLIMIVVEQPCKYTKKH